MKVLLVVAALVGCGSQTISLRHSALEPYAEEFYTDAHLYGVEVRKENVSYHITEPPLHVETPNAVGLCFYGKVSSFILISRTYWNKATHNEKRALMYHELAHCTLGIKHTENPYALMYPTVHSPMYLEENLEGMIKEFFEEVKR
jgi:hypothetical protein